MTGSEEEVQAAILTNLPDDCVFLLAEEAGTGVWTAQFVDLDGASLFESSYPDRKLTLLNAFGYLWGRFYQPRNPIWQRRQGDLRVAAREGLMHLPGSEALPDPDDLDPFAVYDLDPPRRNR